MSITSHRYTRTHNGQTYTTDYYGKVIDTKVTTQIATSQGEMTLSLCWIFLHDELVIEADLWQHSVMHGSGVTTFSATVYVRFEDGMYRVDKRYRGCNAFWVELEGRIRNEISVNS